MNNQTSNDLNLTEIAIEEAAKMGITLGPDDSMTMVTAPNATEEEAREKIREWLRSR